MVNRSASKPIIHIQIYFQHPLPNIKTLNIQFTFKALTSPEEKKWPPTKWPGSIIFGSDFRPPKKKRPTDRRIYTYYTYTAQSTAGRNPACRLGGAKCGTDSLSMRSAGSLSLSCYIQAQARGKFGSCFKPGSRASLQFALSRFPVFFRSLVRLPGLAFVSVSGWGLFFFVEGGEACVLSCACIFFSLRFLIFAAGLCLPATSFWRGSVCFALPGCLLKSVTWFPGVLGFLLGVRDGFWGCWMRCSFRVLE